MLSKHLSASQLFSLQGKKVVCTDATEGIGQEMCIALEEAGADVVSIQLPDDANAQVLSSQLSNIGCSFCSFDCNLWDLFAIQSTFQAIWAAGIVSDILLNCAGVNRRGPVMEMTDEDLDLVRKIWTDWPLSLWHQDWPVFQILSINLKATYVVAQEFAKHLLQLRRPGKIINIGSVTSYCGMRNVSAYASSKEGVIQLTKAFSNELARHNIQVNCICPE